MAFFEGRSKEAAVTVAQCTTWRARRQGRTSVTHLRDLSNAFGRVSGSEFDDVQSDLVLDELEQFGRQRYREAAVQLPSVEGK
eukprot:3832303-Pyramimonas_sp.AAC.1